MTANLNKYSIVSINLDNFLDQMIMLLSAIAP